MSQEDGFEAPEVRGEVDLEPGPRRALVHALRNPLTPIRGYAELLLSRLDAVAPGERALFERGLETIFREARRLEDVVETLDDEATAGTDAVGEPPGGEDG